MYPQCEGASNEGKAVLCTQYSIYLYRDFPEHLSVNIQTSSTFQLQSGFILSFLNEKLLLLLPKSKYFGNILNIQFGMEIVSKCNKKPFKVYQLNNTDLNSLLIFISHGILANDLTFRSITPSFAKQEDKISSYGSCKDFRKMQFGFRYHSKLRR